MKKIKLNWKEWIISIVLIVAALFFLVYGLYDMSNDYFTTSRITCDVLVLPDSTNLAACKSGGEIQYYTIAPARMP